MFVERARYRVREGNRLEALVDGVAAFGRIAAAVDAAQHSVAVTVAWIHDGFRWSDGRSFFDLLDGAAARGVAVRVLFWRAEPSLSIDHSTCFSGRTEHRDFLHGRGSSFGIRWDDPGDAVCHHQKSWVIDAGHEDAIAFVGGMNLNPDYMTEPGHAEPGSHDVFLAIEGPAVADVFENFVDRWNHAPDRDHEQGRWGELGTQALEGCRQPPRRGDSRVQIQRTMKRTGEATIHAQYLRAIDAAERFVYIENQALKDLDVIEALHRALDRDVWVVVLSNARDPEARPLAEAAGSGERLHDLCDRSGFTIAGLSVARGPRREPVNVHAKLMLIDDRFATIGSCNARWQSFQRHSELNAAIEDPAFVLDLRCRLFAEHLGLDVRGHAAREAVRLYAEIARSNRAATTAWQGRVVSLSPTEFAN